MKPKQTTAKRPYCIFNHSGRRVGKLYRNDNNWCPICKDWFEPKPATALGNAPEIEPGSLYRCPYCLQEASSDDNPEICRRIARTPELLEHIRKLREALRQIMRVSMRYDASPKISQEMCEITRTALAETEEKS